MNSDSSLTLFRKFGYLRARILLAKQDELAEMEEQLESLDVNEAKMFNLTTRRRDSNQKRQELLLQITEKLESYGALSVTLALRPLTHSCNRPNARSLSS